ncbi:RluA family pseudouridine synthase [Synergistes jonesii]|uniref:RluA family pseudouridine synthase n=1 Tax=Synergistes jonesii TaxID=2754 RepID=UPI00068FCE86|nr:RluA family pseudouridine synthase [Synergistes jonesii]
MCSTSSSGTGDKIFEEGEGLSSAPSSVVQRFEITAEFDGHRVDFALSRLLGVSRAFSQRLIKEGRAELFPPRRIKASLKVAAGDAIRVEVPPAETLDLEPQDVDFETVYEDSDIIVVNKPAGLVVHPAPGHWSGTLVHGLLFRYPDIGTLNGVRRPGIVHRLDATTSGLMVVARNGLAQEGLFRDFKARRVQKEYLALCYGMPPNGGGSVKCPIGRDPRNRQRMACVEGGREARTDYRTLWSSNAFSLLACTLHSGRTHQIRVHMRALRCPLVGDRLYAPSRQSPFPPERIFLHSWKLAFRHPRSGGEMSFVQPLPEELTDYLKKVREGK